MKWPETLTLVRHDVSTYNELKPKKEADPLYQEFLRAYDDNPASEACRALAQIVKDKFALPHGDHNTPLSQNEGMNAYKVGISLCNLELIPKPDIIFVSPYLRAQQTLERIVDGWPELESVEVKPDVRIRELDHGIAADINDLRVFNVMYPDQAEHREKAGEYYYQWPEGENGPRVEERLWRWNDMLIREYSQKNALAVSHHQTILLERKLIEGFSAEEYIRLDRYDKPINAGLTIYKGHPQLGRDGKLVLDKYNLKLY